MQRMPLMSTMTALTLVGLAACSGENPSGPPDTEVYQLTRINDVDVPSTTPDGLELISGQFSLASDRTCSRQVAYRWSSSSGTVLDSRPCHWSANGSLLDIVWANSTQTSAELSELELTLRFATGIMCVTMPCPSEWIESYVQVP